MASVTVTIKATDGMSSTIANLQKQLNALQQKAGGIKIGADGNASGQVDAAVKEAEAKAKRLSAAFSNLGSVVLAGFVASLRSAYNEIKAIDDELVVVRRITGKTSEELAGMTENAHRVAQRYGVDASDYLEGVANFTRAGYGDQAESLAELSVQLQRAGDVSATTANAYMTAVDKAYAMGGSIEALTAAMDGANQIGNEYATNVAEIAAGIGKVASIAATGHVGIDELTAALGTITAVTQRSGTEAATALRAIFLNIMGDISTEIEEGATWTAGEIEGLNEVLRIYAPEVVAAAEATDTLIDPMVAIGALAKSYQQGILTEAKLFGMVSDIGGKLRTNQLMVLIKNWDMYESMLETYANASGSIATEVENSMDSISAKLTQVKAAWVALVNDTVSTSFIKGFLDGINTAINAVGNLQTALTLVLGAVVALKSQKLGTLFSDLFANGSTAAAKTLAGTISGIGKAMFAVSTIISAANGAINSYNSSLQKQIDNAEKQQQSASTSSNEIAKLYSVYMSATEGSKQYTTALTALAEALGLTAEQAQNAGNSISGLTLQSLQQATANAEAALNTYNHARTSMVNTFGESRYYTGDIKTLPSELQAIAQAYEDLSKVSRVDSKMFTGFAIEKYSSAETLVKYYREAIALQEELNLAASQNGLNVTDYQYYNSLNQFISEMQTEYQTALTFINTYAEAYANSLIPAMQEYQDMLKANADMEDGQADVFSTEQIEAFADAMDALASGMDKTTVKGQAAYEMVLKKFAELFPNLVKYSEEYEKTMGQSGTDAVDDGASSAASAVNTLAVALSTATKAKMAFDAAMEHEPENANFSNYQSAYEAYAQEMEAGRVNSRTAMAAAEYLMAGTQYDFSKLYGEGGYAAVNAAMKNGYWATMFAEGKDYGEGLLTVLSKVVNKQGELVDSNGNVIATYKKTGKQVKFQIKDLQGLSKATGLSMDQIYQAMQSLSVYGDVSTESIDNAVDSLAELGQVAGVTEGENGGLSVNYQQLLDFMRESGQYSAEDWSQMKDWLYFLNEIGEIELTDVPDAEEGWQNIDDWAKETAESAESAAESMEQAAESAESAQSATPSATADAAQEAEAAQAAAEGYSAMGQAAAEGGAQVAALNTIIAQLRESSGDAAADEFLKKLVAAAEEAGGEIQTLDGYIQSITGPDSSMATWEFITSLITQTGLAEAALDGLAVKIAGLSGHDYQITFSVDPDGQAVSHIQQIENDSNTTARERDIKFNTDGTISLIDYVEDKATQTARTRTINYDANGNITNISEVETNAEQVTYTRTINYDANGNIANITEVNETADGPTKTIKEFKYAADGSLLMTEVVTMNTLADGDTQVVRSYKYDADDHLLVEKISTINSEAEIEEEHTVYYDANGNTLIDVVTQTVTNANEETDKLTTYFVLGANGEQVEITAQQAEKILMDSYGGDYGTYELSANSDGVVDAVDESETEIATSVEDDWGEYQLNADNGAVYDAVSEVLKWLETIPETVRVSIKTTFESNPYLAPFLDYLSGEKGISLNPYPEVIEEDPFEAAAKYKPIVQALEFWNTHKPAGEQNQGADTGPTMEDLLPGVSGTDDWIKLYEEEAEEAATEAAEGAVQAIEEQNQEADTGPTMEDLLPGVSGADDWIKLYEEEAEEAATEAAEGAVQAIEEQNQEADTGPTMGDLLPGVSDADDWIKLYEEEAEEAVEGLQKEAEKATEEAPVTIDVIPELDADSLQDVSRDIDENGNPIVGYHFEIEGQDAVIDTLEYIDAETQDTHTIKIMTKADGSQIIEETITDAETLEQKTYVTNIDAEGNAVTTLTTIEELENTVDKAITASVNADTGAAYRKLSALKTLLQQIKNKTVKVTTVVQGDTITPARNAKGTTNFSGGLSTVNEEGPELIVSNGQAVILGNGEETLAAIPKGATIYTAEETAQLLSGNLSNAVIPGKPGDAGGGTITLPTTPSSTTTEETSTGQKIPAGGGGSGSGSGDGEDEFWDTIREYIEYGLTKIEHTIQEYQRSITALERARDALLDPIEDLISDLDYSISVLDHEISLIERERDAAVKPLDDEIERLKKERDIREEDAEIEQRRLDLQEALHQRTVRYFNEETGQWEWMADQNAIADAQEALEDAEADYAITLLERERDAINDSYQERIDEIDEQRTRMEQEREDQQFEADRINHEYDEAIEPIQDQIDAIQNMYDDLQQYYETLVDAVEVPTESLSAAIAQMATASSNYTDQLQRTIDLLDALYERAPTFSAIDVGDLGPYAPTASHVQNNTDNSTNVTINGVKLSGSQSEMIVTALKKSGIYK